jgi:two-component system, LytTR family, sensor kinase
MESLLKNPFSAGEKPADVILSTNGAYHMIFWGIVLIILTIVEGTRHGFVFTFTNELINVFFYALIVYLNLFYLIPKYLTQKRFLAYAAYLVLAIVLITPIKILVFYLKFNHVPASQRELLDHQLAYFLINFFVATTSTIYKIVTDWVIQLREKQELENETMQSELRFLKSQINPHFLFNTLNSLYALTLKKSDLAPEIVIKLSEMMRYMLYDCNEKRVMLSKEIAYLQNYLDLERLRQGNVVDIKLSVEGLVSEQKIAPLLFIPFVENSFKHGVNHYISGGAFVNVHLKVEGLKVDFTIENSKPEKAPMSDPNRRSGGIGLVNVHRRLNLIYPKRYELKIDNNPKSYSVHLDIDLDDQEKPG